MAGPLRKKKLFFLIYGKSSYGPLVDINGQFSEKMFSLRILKEATKKIIMEGGGGLKAGPLRKK